jgi:hypothetical protein
VEKKKDKRRERVWAKRKGEECEWEREKEK